jgi:LacI family transcriptional regulator
LLGELMHGKLPPSEPIRIPPVGLIARKSSDLIAVQHSGVARSLKFIWEHYHEPIGIEDLTKVSAMSRSRLHQAFLDHIGRSPGHEIHRLRIERAKSLLAEPQHKIDAIAEMCGYNSPNSFWVAFRHTTGMSPQKYRKNFLKPIERGARP